MSVGQGCKIDPQVTPLPVVAAVAADVSRITDLLDEGLRKPAYRNHPNPLRGHCYVVSEAIWHLKYKELGYTPHIVRVGMETHWFLKRGPHIVDLTAGQYGAEPEYDNSKRQAFMTRKPSKRARELMRRYHEAISTNTDASGDGVMHSTPGRPDR